MGHTDLPIVVASANGRLGMDAAVAALRTGVSALDAVEAGCRAVERDPQDHSVGRGGYPNADGQVELDASIMEGATRRAGAVAALQGYLHPVSVARAILEKLPHHVLLTGEGAARFARECGFPACDLLTDEARQAWESRRAAVPAGERMRPEVPRTGGRDESGEEERDLMAMAESLRGMADPQCSAGTVNFLARDAAGRIASAVSTSGWAFKYPGRVGDSPLIGAGNYCDDRYGACACTGLGEWAIRSGTARLVVASLERGMSLEDACRRALEDLNGLPLPPTLDAAMNLVALDTAGNHAGFSTQPGRTYVWQTPEMAECREEERSLTLLRAAA